MRGITLIEVLVVIVIFSILATIAIPAFNNWRIRISIESDVKDIYAFVQKGPPGGGVPGTQYNPAPLS